MNKHIIKKLVNGLIILMMIQSCTLYKGPVSLEEAYKENKRTKVFTKYDERIVFKSIIKESNKYYGVSRKMSEPNVYLDVNSIDEVKVVDQLGSIAATILIPATFLGLIALTVSDGFQFKYDPD